MHPRVYVDAHVQRILLMKSCLIGRAWAQGAQQAARAEHNENVHTNILSPIDANTKLKNSPLTPELPPTHTPESQRGCKRCLLPCTPRTRCRVAHQSSRCRVWNRHLVPWGAAGANSAQHASRASPLLRKEAIRRAKGRCRAEWCFDCEHRAAADPRPGSAAGVSSYSCALRRGVPAGRH